MTIKEILKKTYKENVISKKVIDTFYLEWQSLFLRTRNASKEMLQEMISKLIPGINIEHKAVIQLQTYAIASFNNYRNLFNNSIELLAATFVDAKNMQV